MDPLVENEARLHITNGIEKASAATGVDIKVSAKLKRKETANASSTSRTQLLTWICFCFNSKHAKLWKIRWTGSTDTLSTASWARASLLRWPVKQINLCTFTTQVNWLCSSSSADRPPQNAFSLVNSVLEWVALEGYSEQEGWPSELSTC